MHTHITYIYIPPPPPPAFVAFEFVKFTYWCCLVRSRAEVLLLFALLLLFPLLLFAATDADDADARDESAPPVRARMTSDSLSFSLS